MPKITIVSPAYPYRGGQALVEAHLYHTLTQNGFDCHTVTFSLLYPSIFFPGKTQYERSNFIPYPHQDKIVRLINSINPISWWKTAQYIAKQGSDAVIFVWWMPFFGPAYWTIIQLLRQWTNTKILFLVENYISHEHRWFDKFFSKQTLRLADAFICESSFVENALKTHHPTIPVFRTTLELYDCYDLGKYTKESARKALGIPLDKPVILYFGLIRPYKGVDRLIQAFPLIKEKIADCQLLIVGECYEPLEKYQRLIESLPVKEGLYFMEGYVANEEMEKYFKAADIVCLPYYHATQSGVLMVAYAFKKPVVVTKVGGLPELVVPNKTGKIIPDNAPEHIAKACCELLQEDLENYAQHISQLSETLGYKRLPELIRSFLQ